jgi:hypothetical protein
MPADVVWGGRDANGYQRPITGWNATYCGKCGSLTREEVERSSGFDDYYGVPRMKYRRVCPYRSRLFDGHFGGYWEPLQYMTAAPLPPPPPPDE